MLNPEEEGLLLAQCASHLKPLIITALHTEFRASELLSLTWADVDFSHRVITVRAAYVKNGERRRIPMNDVLTATLQTVKMEISEGDTVFRTPQGRRYRNFRTAFEQAVQRAGLMDFTFHDLRHILASRFYNSARTLQKTDL
jgi:integrase